MNQDLELLMDGLEKVDGYLVLGMWEPAWNVLEGLPGHLKNHPDVLVRKIDVLAGSELWNKALILAEGTVAVYPLRAEVWQRLARLQAQAGQPEAARASARNCVELDPDMQLEVFEDRMLQGIW